METAAASLSLCQAARPTNTNTNTNTNNKLIINHRVPVTSRYCSRQLSLDLEPSPNGGKKTSSLQMSMRRRRKRTTSTHVLGLSLKQQQLLSGHHHHHHHHHHVVVVGCVSSCAAAAAAAGSSSSSSAGLLGDLEKELELELLGEQELEWMRERCSSSSSKGRKLGMVELLECLETEAIMGEDQGKDPTDYNRRAQIFDKSSRVFQALKAQTTHHLHQS